ncbi:MAG TPA: HlyD family efflux transporter periplasmic adaptor subunit, partial [Acidimicrobiales bacterium]|nr:HlyD family efflux transporter periplasmic adaptor subunit [Acidimicrobiales bacterium]
WPIRVGAVYVKAGDPVQPGEPILQLTEPTVSVTLQASAADRTNLQLGQTCTIQISGDQTTVTGTITELDATATVLNAGGAGGAAGGGGSSGGAAGGGATQVYEGRIDSAQLDTLHGADGSAVSIKVVEKQVTDAPTVPIAAVKQNGVGTDVVRVIDPSGEVTEVPVVTGLSEGSYIEIKSGVSVGQTVVVQPQS